MCKINSMKLASFCAAGLLFLCASCGEADDGSIVAEDGSYDVATLASSGGMPPTAHAGDECGAGYTHVISVDRTAATVTWDRCWYEPAVGHSTISQGTRSLTPDELASVRDALLQVKVGNGGQCGLDKPTVTLDVEVQGRVGRYVDDFYGCRPAPDGRTFVTKIDWVESAMWKLAN